MAPKVYEQEAIYQPKYAELEAANQAYLGQQALAQATKLFPQVSQIEAQYDADTRAAELSQLQQTLPEYQRAFNALTPGYQQATEAAGQLAQQSMRRSLQAPQLTNFEAQVGSPYGAPAPQQMQQRPPAMQGQSMQAPQGQPQGGGKGTPPPPQGGGFAGQMQQQLQGQPQGQPPVSAMPTAPSQLLGQAPAPQGQQGPAQAGQPQGGGKGTPPPPQGPAGNFSGQMQQQLGGQQPQGQPMGPQGLQQTPAGGYVGQVQQFQPANVGAIAGTPQEVGYLDTVGNAQQVAALAGNVPGMSNLDATRSAQMAAASAGKVPGGVAMQGVQTAAKAAAQAGAVPTGRNTAGMRTVDAALKGLAAVPGAENLAGVAGPQLQSGLENVNQGSVDQYLSAMPGMQDYARMLAQQSQAELSAGRGLTAEEQRMADQSARSAYAARGTALGGQAINAEILNRADVSNQRYQQRLQNAAQAAGTIQGIYQPALAQSLQRQQAGLQYDINAQGQAFNQAETRDTLAQAQQAQQYAQTLGAQTAGFSQAQARDTLSAQLQAQKYGQLTGTQQTGFSQAQAKDVFGRDTQAQKYSQAMGTQAAGFGQAQTKDTMAAQLQQQRYNQLTGSQETAFSQAGARENVAQQIQQQRYGQAMGQQGLLQGAQGQAFEQAMGREGLAAGTQQTAFNQALQRGQAEQQRLQFGTTYQAGQAQLGAGAMSQLQSAQQPVLQAFYNQPILQGQVGQSQMFGQNMGQASGPQLFNPESQTGMGSIYGAYNSQMNLAGASLQANAAKQAGKSSLMGSLGGAAIGALGMLCWVAREVYGEENPKWLEFRKWLISNADDNLLDAYIEHGEEFAAFISDKPKLKQLVKTWMDSKIS